MTDSEDPVRLKDEPAKKQRQEALPERLLRRILEGMGGILRALPMTGITLPFVSHGGFSLITSFAMLGMLMAFSSRNARDRVIADRPAPKSSSPLKLEAVQ